WDMLFARHGIRILAYHGVESPPSNPFSVSVENFEKQMAHISKRFDVIDLDTFLKWLDGSYKSNKRKIVITFDDGFQNNLVHAPPILKKYGLPATFFVITSKLDAADDRFMTTNDISSLLQSDLFKIGSHTLSHRSISQISDDERERETGASKAQLESRFS